ncbi:MAG: helix-turn-helix domain-containing protein [Acidobacteria bacterium]|nr:helix-turn-helix domain-containing protein [Acidobacteriota bacterium]
MTEHAVAVEAGLESARDTGDLSELIEAAAAVVADGLSCEEAATVFAVPASRVYRRVRAARNLWKGTVLCE